MTYVLLPLISAAIGWLTNFLAVKMLFHPRNPIKIGGLNLQGIFPKRKPILAERLSKTITTQLISIDEIMAEAPTMGSDTYLTRKIDNAIDRYLKKELPKNLNPIIAPFISRRRLGIIKKSIKVEIESLIPELKAHYLGEISNIDLEKLIYDKILNFPNEQLEALLMAVLKKELRFIELVGAIVGFLIGMVQIGILRFMA